MNKNAEVQSLVGCFVCRHRFPVDAMTKAEFALIDEAYLCPDCQSLVIAYQTQPPLDEDELQ